MTAYATRFGFLIVVWLFYETMIATTHLTWCLLHENAHNLNIAELIELCAISNEATRVSRVL